jgi:16S rRNA processing protein RimM
LRGDVVVHSDSDHPGRFAPAAVFVVDGDPDRALTVDRSTPVPGGFIVTFAGVHDRDAADALRGATLFIHAAQRRPLDEDEYWLDDLVGAVAVDTAGGVLGTVTGVEFGEAQDRIVVTLPDGVAVEVPFVEAIVTAVSPGESRVVIDPPEGLFPG